MKILTFTLLIIMSNHVLAQDFAPVGSVWHYTNIENFFSQDKGYVKIESVGDTVIQGKTCKLLTNTRYGTTGSITQGNDEYLYVSGDTIFRLSDNDTFYVLYNFGAKVGDTWVTRSSDPFSFEETEIRVDSTATTTINGEVLRVLFVSSLNGVMGFGGSRGPAGGKAKIIERLGGSWYMFPQNYGSSDWEIRIGLRCYSDPNFGFYNSGITSDCELIIVNVEEIENKYGISIYPNPSSERINIKFGHNPERKEISLYSLQGNLIFTEKLDQNQDEMDFLIPQQGIYLLKIKLNGSETITEKIVIN